MQTLYNLFIVTVFCLTQFCFDEYVICFNVCATLFWLFMWYIFKGHFDNYDISTLASTVKFYFSFIKISLKKQNINIWPLHFLCSIIWHQYQFDIITNFSMLSFFLFHPSRRIHWCFIKMIAWILKDHPSITSISEK